MLALLFINRFTVIVAKPIVNNSNKMIIPILLLFILLL